ncbi:hypothetical protein D6810_00465, partial [Candidatus Dojkabacteria bacterium]
MISKITGIIEQIDIDNSRLYLKTDFGISFVVYTINLKSLRNGDSIELFTIVLYREESHTIWGFKSSLLRDLFELLISVNGVGPKMAASLIEDVGYENILKGIMYGDWTLLKTSGIGQKLTKKIIEGLRDNKKLQSFIRNNDISVDNLFYKYENRVKIEEVKKAMLSLGYK